MTRKQTMSENTHQHSGRGKRETPEAVKAAPEALAGNGEDKAAAAPTLRAEIKYKDGPELSVDFPRNWLPGSINTEHSALMIDTFRVRQFCSTAGANAKARAERFAKATTDAEKVANAPLSPQDYVTAFLTYEGPAIGDMQRMSTMERLKHEATWSAWVAWVTDHNNYVQTSGGTPPELFNPPIKKAGKATVPVGYSIPGVKKKGESDEDFAERKTAAQSARTAFIERMLSMPEHAEKIQIQLDRILAERGKGKEGKGDTLTIDAGDSLL
jgi:hypothetical protein